MMARNLIMEVAGMMMATAMREKRMVMAPVTVGEAMSVSVIHIQQRQKSALFTSKWNGHLQLYNEGKYPLAT